MRIPIALGLSSLGVLSMACSSAARGSSAGASGGGDAGSTSSSSSGAGSSSSPAASSNLVVETSFVLKTVDPARMFEPTGLMIDHVLYDTLLTYKGSNVSTPVPDLAMLTVATRTLRDFLAA